MALDSFRNDIAEASLRHVETGFLGFLAPAVAVMRTTALTTQMGIITGITVAEWPTLQEILMPEFVNLPALNKVRLSTGDAGLRIFPGSSREKQNPESRQLAFQQASPNEDFFLEPQDLKFGDAALPIAGFGPETLLQDPSDPNSWRLGYGLATKQPLKDTSDSLRLWISVDLSAAAEAVKLDRAGVSAYICTADGLLIAGSSWTAKLKVVDDTPAFESLWDLGETWTSGVSRDVVASTKQTKLDAAEAVIMVRPIRHQVGFVEGLRVIAVATMGIHFLGWHN